MKLRRRAARIVTRFWRLAWNANITGQSAMLAYNMLLGVIPVALLALFIGGQVLSSHAVQASILTDLREVFPGTTKSTLGALLHQVQSSTTSTGIGALVASLWLASSFFGALDTAFGRIYGCGSRRWIVQKRFGFEMVGVLLLFMVATVAVPTVQSFLRAQAHQLPLDLRHINDVAFVISLVISLALLFGCLSIIYVRVPNCSVRWRTVWPGALGATLAIGVIAYAFPIYLSSISTIARFKTTVVFVVIVLGWFYVVALIILSGGIVNALRIRADDHELEVKG